MNGRTIAVGQDVRAERQAAAERWRQRRKEEGTLVVRLLSSPGAGKTTLLEATARALAGEFRMGVLVGDIETDRDAQRLRPWVPTLQITTGGLCHLELPLVERALPELSDSPFEILFLEDVGNLVCPASHDLGEHVRVVLLSTPEGDDKPGKYPKAFRSSDALVITKVDLVPYVPFSIEAAEADARRIQPRLRVFSIAARAGAGMDDWLDFLRERRHSLLHEPAAVCNGPTP